MFNRGNYRQDLFTVHRTGEAFEKSLLEASERYEWILHAYVVMRNHYHLVLETPVANLSTGMQWLQSVFANRFNQFRKERGHVFQGRYKALVVEPGRNLSRVIDYVHLNPVRAGLISLMNLHQYRPSSFSWAAMPKRMSPKSLTDAGWRELGGYPPGRRGSDQYRSDLAVSDPDLLRSGTELDKEFCRGWVVGSEPFKARLLEAEDTPDVLIGADRQGTSKADHESYWETVTSKLIVASGHSEADVAKDRKSAGWKLEIASNLKATTGVSNPWMAKRLNLGHPCSASKNVSVFRKRQKSKA